MINLISEKSGADVRVGQNGIVVVNGPPAAMLKALKAVKMVDAEAHAGDLVAKVEGFLGGSSDGGN